jgi:hypothetical protein
MYYGSCRQNAVALATLSSMLDKKNKRENEREKNHNRNIIRGRIRETFEI